MLIMFFNKTTTFLIHLENNQDLFVTCLFHYNRVYKSGWPWIIEVLKNLQKSLTLNDRDRELKKNLQKHFPIVRDFSLHVYRFLIYIVLSNY